MTMQRPLQGDRHALYRNETLLITTVMDMHIGFIVRITFMIVMHYVFTAAVSDGGREWGVSSGEREWGSRG